jgi:hypothetical protein
MTGYRAAGASGKSERLQQRHRGGHAVWTDHGDCGCDGPFGTGDDSQ